MKEIILSRGQVAIVDDEDYEWLNQWKWYFVPDRVNGGYAVHFDKSIGKLVSMHRVIMNHPQGLQVDHINGIKTDNRRSNLRLVTRTQNAQNVRKSKKTKNKYKGVVQVSKTSWIAQITVNRVPIKVGLYKSPVWAARAYDRAARKYFGEFASTNF